MSTPLRDVFEELQFLSDRISTQVRTIAISVLALVWLFLAGGNGSPVLRSPPCKGSLVGIAVVVLLVLILDHLQYVLGYLATDSVRKEAEKDVAAGADYDYSDVRYRTRTYLFWAKQVLVVVAVIWLLIEIVRSV